MLKELCDYIAVSGYEKKLRMYLTNYFMNYKNIEVYNDRIGNVILHKKCNGLKIMYLVHIDEIGFQISKKIKNNYYEFKNLGNIKFWNLINQPIVFDNQIEGIIVLKENITKPTNINELCIYSSSDLVIGDVATFKNNFKEDTNNFISKSLDNRISLFAVINCLKKSELNLNYDFYCVFSVQEELGLRGAKVAISQLKPDIVITLDTTAICERNNIEYGEGVCIKISDSIGVSDQNLVNYVKDICKTNKIKYQLEVSDCGTTEMIMVNENDNGSLNLGISIPCKNMHSSCSFVSKQDYFNFEKLILNLFEHFNIE